MRFICGGLVVAALVLLATLHWGNLARYASDAHEALWGSLTRRGKITLITIVVIWASLICLAGNMK